MEDKWKRKQEGAGVNWMRGDTAARMVTYCVSVDVFLDRTVTYDISRD